MNKTSIEWTHRPETGGAAGGFTWNPIRARLKNCPDCNHRHDLSARMCWHLLNDGGVLKRCACKKKQTGTFCTRISPGCKLCYASAINIRFGNGLEYVVTNLANIEFFIDERIIQEPLQRKKPATIFVGDMFDLFHEAISDAKIAEVLRIAYKLPRHTFQFLTKRAERMKVVVSEAWRQWQVPPPAHMWFGVSVEDQQRADERIPFLLQTPAAVRFLSVEPLLEEIRFRWAKWDDWKPHSRRTENMGPGAINEYDGLRMLDWVICGGESGPGARPFNLVWAEALLEQCQTAGVPFFMKQLGSNAFCEGCTNQDTHFCGMIVKPKDRKGGDPEEWPEHLRVRQFPAPTKGDRAIYLRDEAKVGV